MAVSRKALLNLYFEHCGDKDYYNEMLNDLIKGLPPEDEKEIRKDDRSGMVALCFIDAALNLQQDELRILDSKLDSITSETESLNSSIAEMAEIILSSEESTILGLTSGNDTIREALSIKIKEKGSRNEKCGRNI